VETKGIKCQCEVETKGIECQCEVETKGIECQCEVEKKECELKQKVSSINSRHNSVKKLPTRWHCVTDV